MRLIFILIVLVIGNQAEAQERRWQCIGKDDKELIRLDKTTPCPIGFRAYEIDAQDKIIPNGYDPLANTNSVRCVGISKSIFYGEKECLMQKALGWMKGQPVEVNREGFTPEEAKIDAKRRENLAKQKEWENRHKAQTNQPKVSKLIDPSELVDLRGFETVKSNPKKIKEEDCKSWINSNIADKQKYIEDNCN